MLLDFKIEFMCACARALHPAMLLKVIFDCEFAQHTQFDDGNGRGYSYFYHQRSEFKGGIDTKDITIINHKFIFFLFIHTCILQNE